MNKIKYMRIYKIKQNKIFGSLFGYNLIPHLIHVYNLIIILILTINVNWPINVNFVNWPFISSPNVVCTFTFIFSTTKNCHFSVKLTLKWSSLITFSVHPCSMVFQILLLLLHSPICLASSSTKSEMLLCTIYLFYYS